MTPPELEKVGGDTHCELGGEVMGEEPGDLLDSPEERLAVVTCRPAVVACRPAVVACRPAGVACRLDEDT